MLEIPNFHLTCVKKKLYDVMYNITVFTVNGLPDFIYLILACYQDWIKMHPFCKEARYKILAMYHPVL
jgi:hypothetical protein